MTQVTTQVKAITQKTPKAFQVYSPQQGKDVWVNTNFPTLNFNKGDTITFTLGQKVSSTGRPSLFAEGPIQVTNAAPTTAPATNQNSSVQDKNLSIVRQSVGKIVVELLPSDATLSQLILTVDSLVPYFLGEVTANEMVQRLGNDTSAGVQVNLPAPDPIYPPVNSAPQQSTAALLNDAIIF
jgi:hypothetical protein